MLVTGKCLVLAIKAIKTTVHSADPECALAVFIDAVDGVAAQALWIGGIILIAGEMLGGWVKAVQPPLGANPNRTVPVFVQRPDHIIAQCACVIGNRAIGNEIMAIIAIQS